MMAPFRAVDAQRQAVLLAGGDLADGEHALAAAAEAEQHVDVLVELRSGRKVLLSAHSSTIGSPVTYSSRLRQWLPTSPSVPPMPGLRRIDAPGGLLLAELLVRDHQEVLQVLDDDLADLPHLAGAEQLAGVADQRVAGVVVREGEDQLRSSRRAAPAPAASSSV